MSTYPTLRLRRLRSEPFRTLVQENTVEKHQLVLPLFIKGQTGEKQPISSMPGHFQIPLNKLPEEIDEIVNLGIPGVILFGIPDEKNAEGSRAYADDGIIQKALALIRQQAPDLLVMTDVCLCQYTHHGHCGYMYDQNVCNDTSLTLLVRQAVSHAQAGAHVVAPSAMMDGQVAAIRQGLDAAGFCHIPILSYAVKYQSNLYGPFRQAAEGAPQYGDRSTYQMNPANSQEALREAACDVAEGADMLMVKPGHTYLDIIYRIKQAHPGLPLCAYHTSGEFAMIKAAAEKGWIDEKKVVHEVLLSLRRAGADFIITYYAKEIALPSVGLKSTLS
jgi:porphobilinogen synthase